MAGRRVWSFAAVVAGFVGIVLIWSVVFPDPTENSKAYARQIQVAGGYVDVSVNHGRGGSCNCLAWWYVGPGGVDPTTVFTGPGLAWRSVPEPTDDRFRKPGLQALVTSDVTTAKTGPCSVTVLRETPPFDLGDVVDMSPGQVDGWHERRLDVLELAVQCQRDAGRL